MAGVGQIVPQPSYPSFDSFWFHLNGSCVQEDSETLTFGGEEDNEGPDVLTLESVLMMDVTSMVALRVRCLS